VENAGLPVVGRIGATQVLQDFHQSLHRFVRPNQVASEALGGLIMQSAQHHGTAGAFALRRQFTTLRPVGIFVPQLVRESCRRRGFANIDIVLRWQEIVGHALAAHTWPIRIQWPRRQETILRADGTEAPNPCRTRLVIGAAPSSILEIEYAKGTIIDRVNGYLGYRAVTELAAMADYSIPTGGAHPIEEPEPAVEASGSTLDSSRGALGAALAKLGRAVARPRRSAVSPRPMPGH
jgi:hypothetical protein